MYACAHWKLEYVQAMELGSGLLIPIPILTVSVLPNLHLRIETIPKIQEKEEKNETRIEKDLRARKSNS